MCLKLFKKRRFEELDLPVICRFCESAALIGDDNNVLCCKRGVVSAEYKCRKFSYDPLKREPAPPPPMPKLEPTASGVEPPMFLFGETDKSEAVTKHDAETPEPEKIDEPQTEPTVEHKNE